MSYWYVTFKAARMDRTRDENHCYLLTTQHYTAYVTQVFTDCLQVNQDQAIVWNRRPRLLMPKDLDSCISSCYLQDRGWHLLKILHKVKNGQFPLWRCRHNDKTVPISLMISLSRTGQDYPKCEDAGLSKGLLSFLQWPYSPARRCLVGPSQMTSLSTLLTFFPTKTTKLSNHFCFSVFFHVCMHSCVHTTAHVWSSEDSLHSSLNYGGWQFELPWSVSLGGKNLYPWSHPLGWLLLLAFPLC